MSGTGRIADLVRKLSALSQPQFRLGLSQRLSQEAPKLYRQGFVRQSDPYGKPWDKSKKATGRTLINTGYLIASGETQTVTDNGFKFRVYAPYGIFHQFGTYKMPQRMIVPHAPMGLGNWGPVFTRVAGSYVRELMR
jgi:phage gpG-like protein